jgi:predicted DNA-binding transcriptional regulator
MFSRAESTDHCSMYRWQYASEPTSPEAHYILRMAAKQITRTDVGRDFGIDEKAAADRLISMFRAGMLHRIKDGRVTRYTTAEPWIYIDSNRRKIKCQQRARPEGQMKRVHREA